MRPRWSHPRLLLLMFLAGAANAQVSISGKVIDENGVAVSKARIEARLSDAARTIESVSDAGGNFTLQFPNFNDPEVSIRATKQGYYIYSGKLHLSPQLEHLTVTLNHLQEFAESIDVTYSPP